MSNKQRVMCNRERQEEDNPCFKESVLSLKCMDEGGYDRAKCHAYYENYKACKTFWNHVISDRRSKGLHPCLPPLAERESVKKEYMQIK